MLGGFEAMAESPRRGRLLAVLGQMAELGALSEEAHRRVGSRAAEVFDAVCVLDGERARVLAESAGAELVASRPAPPHRVPPTPPQPAPLPTKRSPPPHPAHS